MRLKKAVPKEMHIIHYNKTLWPKEMPESKSDEFWSNSFGEILDALVSHKIVALSFSSDDPYIMESHVVDLCRANQYYRFSLLHPDFKVYYLFDPSIQSESWHHLMKLRMERNLSDKQAFDKQWSK